MANEVLSFIGTVAPALFTAGGQLGAAAINADATRFVAKQQAAIERLKVQAFTAQEERAAATARLTAELLQPAQAPPAPVASLVGGGSGALLFGLFVLGALAAAWE